MKLLFVAAVAVLCVTSWSSAIPLDDNHNIFHYDGYQVIRTFPSTPEQLKALHELELHGELDFWSDVRNGEATDIMVSPQQIAEFSAFLLNHNLRHETFISDVEAIISEQRAASAARRLVNGPRFDFEDYHSLDEIQTHLQSLAAQFPSLASYQVIGKSYENRDIALLKISTGGTTKRAVFIDGNIHAREWISPATVMYIVNELVVKAHENLDLLSRYDFYVVPNVNPDGYEFSRASTRLWRKTRSNHDGSNVCLGVDGNRNYGYDWGDPTGADPNKCGETYMGPSVFSEQENAAIRDFILETAVPWEYFLTFHSYGQYVLLPWGDGTRPDDFEELKAKGDAFATAVAAVSGTPYSVGNTRDLLYKTSGTSQDWGKGSANIKYSYTIELRDKGATGFLLPPAQIIPTGLETFAGFKALFQ